MGADLNIFKRLSGAWLDNASTIEMVKRFAHALLVFAILADGAWSRADVAIGGVAGATSATMIETYDCPPQSNPVDVFCSPESAANQSRRGVALGGFARYALTRVLLIESDLVYAQKGYNRTQPTFHVDYVEMPLLLRFDPVRQRSQVRLFVDAGLSPAVRVHCNNSGDVSVNGMAQHYSVTCGDPYGYNSPVRPPGWFDLGAVVGAGIGVDLSAGIVEIEARYEQGIIDNGAWYAGGKTINKATFVLFSYGRTL